MARPLHLGCAPLLTCARGSGGPQVNEEWGGVVSAARDWAGKKPPAGGVPVNTKYDTRPFEPEDDDEYRTDAPKGAVPQHTTGVGPNLAHPVVHLDLACTWLDVRLDVLGCCRMRWVLVLLCGAGLSGDGAC